MISMTKIKTRIHIWDLKGYVRLKEEFIKCYRRRVKSYGVTKLANELNISYATIAFYRKNKLVNIDLLEKTCKILNIDKSFAEKSIVSFTQNLKNKYKIKFPIKITPLHLRAACMIVGDGSGSLNECCKWNQKSSNIHWGIDLIEHVINHEPNSWDCINSNCKTFTIPKFLVESIALFLNLKSGQIKSYEFFEKVCKLSNEWRFQVFAQLVVDEGSPIQCFIIAQRDQEIKRGILNLIKSLGYSGNEIEDGIYIFTESFPKIKENLKSAKKKFGKSGGFWFKDEKFEKACRVVDPEYSKTLHSNDKKFVEAIEKLKNKRIFSYRDLVDLTNIAPGAISKRINRLLKENKITRLRKNLYIFPELIDKEELEWLRLSKEEKVLKFFPKSGFVKCNNVFKKSKLSSTEFYRAINCLLKEDKIRRPKKGFYALVR